MPTASVWIGAPSLNRPLCEFPFWVWTFLWIFCYIYWFPRLLLLLVEQILAINWVFTLYITSYNFLFSFFSEDLHEVLYYLLEESSVLVLLEGVYGKKVSTLKSRIFSEAEYCIGIVIFIGGLNNYLIWYAVIAIMSLSLHCHSNNNSIDALKKHFCCKRKLFWEDNISAVESGGIPSAMLCIYRLTIINFRRHVIARMNLWAMNGEAVFFAILSSLFCSRITTQKNKPNIYT